MLGDSPVFSGFSVDDLDKAKQFYGEVLGIDVTTRPEGLELHFKNGASHFIYPKPDHQPATFTVLNFPVEDIDATVDTLISAGIEFDHYDNEYIKTDEKGIARPPGASQGPTIAWFKDPAGNTLSVLQQ